MCGISGKIERAPAEPDRLEARLRAPLDAQSNAFRAIRPRGPDSHGAMAFGCRGNLVSLAHSRLSIIDLSELGGQPMHDDVSGWWIAYNGEIYNYLEVREELRALGWSFRSNSDTEVLLKAWAQWRLDALTRLNGMFALAAFRPGSGELWLARDRFGVKPLAWGRVDGGDIVFSSSVAAVADQVSAEIDTDYCARGLRYKAYETAHSGSPFQRVKTVPAGGWVKFHLSRHRTDVMQGNWYDLKQAVAARMQSVAAISEEDLVQQCSDLLQDAVRLRLRSDVPVAVSLSGGLDSSSIAALASKHVGRLRGFTYGSPLDAASEGPVVQAFSGAIGMGVNYVWPHFDKNGLHDALVRTLVCQEAPFSGLSQIAQNELYRHVRNAGFKVLLGGQGGDEAFAGYRKFFIVAVREALQKRQPRNSLLLLCSLAQMLASESGQARLYWQNLGRYRNKADAGFRLLDWKPVTENLWGEEMVLSARQIDDIQLWSLPTLLRYEDRNSMGYGVESRLPFMDYRLVELALALPLRLKIRHGYGKWALREITAGLVPDVIRLERKKRGFDVTQDWVRGGLGASLRRLIFDNRRTLAVHLRPGADLCHLLSDASLSGDSNLLNEALMLAWLAQPVRLPQAEFRDAPMEAGAL